MAKQFGWILAGVMWCAPAEALAGTLGRQATEKEREHQARSGHESRSQDPRWKWWINPEDRKEFGITDQQSAQIEQIWEAYAPTARSRIRELEKLEEGLSKTIKDGSVDVPTLTQMVSRVEKLRAEQTTARTVMLYRMMQVLSPEQRPKVEALLARRAEARRRQQAERDKDKTDARGSSSAPVPHSQVS